MIGTRLAHYEITSHLGLEESAGRKFLVMEGDHSPRPETGERPYPEPGGKRQVSTAGGGQPRWRHDGTEIFYFPPDNTLMAAAVNGLGASFEVGVVRPLFETRRTGLRNQYAATSDGQRFLINTAPEQATSVPITVVVNWTAGLKP